MKYIIYWTNESYPDENGQEVQDYGLRAYSNGNEQEFEQKVSEIASENVIYYNGVLTPDSIPDKFKAFEELQDGYGTKMIYEVFIDSVKRQFDTKVSEIG